MSSIVSSKFGIRFSNRDPGRIAYNIVELSTSSMISSISGHQNYRITRSIISSISGH